MNSNWNSESEHAVKRQANDFVFSMYGGMACRLALSMPSLTAGCMRQCLNHGIFDAGTMHVVIERGGFKYNGKSVTYDMYKDALSDVMNGIFSTDKYLSQQCRLYWGELGDGMTNIGMREKPSSIEWGNYDTCSFVYSIDRWLKYHLRAFRDNAPIILTFDADYENRQWTKNRNSIVFSNTAKQRGVLTKWFNMPCINRLCHNDELLDLVENVKMAGAINYLESVGVAVDFAGCYREDNEQAKLMMMFSGRKKHLPA